MRLKPRKKDAHKGDFGHVFILAGARGMAGAACLCAQAAVRSGAGLVTLGMPESVYPLVAGQVPEAMTVPLPQTSAGTLSGAAYAPLMRSLRQCSVLALGPGLSRHAQTQQLIRRLIKAWNGPLVIDADGLNALVGHCAVLSQHAGGTVITPHPGEMARLTGVSVDAVQKKRRTLAKQFSCRYNNVTVLKGSGTIVSDAAQCYVNTTGNPGMATGGSGDVLTGILAGFIAQQYSLFEAAKIAVYVHGLAGDIAAREVGQTALCARDIITFLPLALKQCE